MLLEKNLLENNRFCFPGYDSIRK